MKKFIIFIILTMMMVLPSAADEKERSKGVIFNISSLLDNLNSYQGGVGIKLGKDETYYRFVGDFFYNHENKANATKLGITIEKHLQNERIRPYWGLFFDISYINPNLDEENYIIPMNAGGIFGIEVFFLPFLSFFSEYQLGANVEYDNSTSDYSMTIDSKIGNNGQIGLIIYLSNVVSL